jgi:hypothetical protein
MTSAFTVTIVVVVVVVVDDSKQKLLKLEINYVCFSSSVSRNVRATDLDW